VKGAALSLIVVLVLAAVVVVNIAWPTVYRETITRSGAGDRPRGLHRQTPEPTHRPYDPLR
jgi:hypothetical protein